MNPEPGVGISEIARLSDPKASIRTEGPARGEVPESTQWSQSADSVRWTQSAQTRRDRIALVAYYRFEARGFAPGQEAADWLFAQAEVDASLAASFGD
jgi:hypothetical protein